MSTIQNTLRFDTDTFGGGAADVHQAIGVRERQPLEQAAVDDAEDRGAEADPQLRSAAWGLNNIAERCEKRSLRAEQQEVL